MVWTYSMKLYADNVLDLCTMNEIKWKGSSLWLLDYYPHEFRLNLEVYWAFLSLIWLIFSIPVCHTGPWTGSVWWDSSVLQRFTLGWFSACQRCQRKHQLEQTSLFISTTRSLAHSLKPPTGKCRHNSTYLNLHINPQKRLSGSYLLLIQFLHDTARKF